AAERRAISDRNPARFVEQNAQHPPRAVGAEFHVDELDIGLVREGLSQLANFFSDFQFDSGQGQKRSGGASPTPIRDLTRDSAKTASASGPAPGRGHAAGDGEGGAA